MLLDAKKEDYLDYLKAVEPRLRQGRPDHRGQHRHLPARREAVLSHVRGGRPYTSREYDFGFDCMEVSVFKG